MQDEECRPHLPPPPLHRERSPKILLLELGFATIRVCGRCSDGSGRGVLWSRDSRSRGTARDVCESSARLRAWVSCRVGWRLSVVCRGWSGAELRPERNLCIRKNTFVHRLPRTHSHKIIIRIALLQSLNSTTHGTARCGASSAGSCTSSRATARWPNLAAMCNGTVPSASR